MKEIIRSYKYVNRCSHQNRKVSYLLTDPQSCFLLTHKNKKRVYFPTQQLCILVPTLLWYLICTNFLKWCILVLSWTNLHYIWCKFIIIIKKIYAETAPSNCAIVDEFSAQHRPQGIKKHHI